jgi:hypothetical protein
LIYSTLTTDAAAGPAILYDNVLSGASFAASDAVTAGYAAANVATTSTFDAWSPVLFRGGLYATLPVARSVEMIGIAAHNLNTLGADLIVDYSATDTGAWVTLCTFPVANLAAGGTEAAGRLFAPVIAKRLRFYAVSPTEAKPIIGVIFAGMRLNIPAYIVPPYVKSRDAAQVSLSPSVSLGGQYLGGTQKRLGLYQEVSFSPVPRDFAESDLQTFASYYNSGTPFFWAGSPSLMGADFAYSWRDGSAEELRPSALAGGLYVDLKMRLAGYGG